VGNERDVPSPNKKTNMKPMEDCYEKVALPCPGREHARFLGLQARLLGQGLIEY
jgi:hypothetical protein